MQAIKAYVVMLRQLYNTGSEQLILDPFIVSESAMQDTHTPGKLNDHACCPSWQHQSCRQLHMSALAINHAHVRQECTKFRCEFIMLVLMQV